MNLQSKELFYTLIMHDILCAHFEPREYFMATDTDVLVIGAGPIGLLNAWAMKRLNSDLNVVVLEKYEEYQRTHSLILKYEHLAELMRVLHVQDPELLALVEQLKYDPNMRTNKLQERLTKLAKDIGVKVLTRHEVKEDEIKQLLRDEYPNVQLIVGADGTHSVVSRTLFPEDNQVKYEFDYVLQLRYDISGSEKAPRIYPTEFYQKMARKGLVANEYVGHYEDGKTPVTMQMMISKEDFELLKAYTSKNPMFLYESSDDIKSELPPRLKSFITGYISAKIQATQPQGHIIDYKTIRISVNEAPATHARQVVTQHNQARVILKGDSALGLSYFIGLNAGLEATIHFFTYMKETILDSFKNKSAMDNALAEYQSWFLNVFAPKKVKEVADYSFKYIRSGMFAMQATRSILESSAVDDDYDDLDDAITDYLKHFIGNNPGQSPRFFAHRPYDPVQFSTLSYVPPQHTLKKIEKVFTDYGKPYKSPGQIKEDLKQPLRGVAHLAIGAGKSILGLVTSHSDTLTDGLSTAAGGFVEVVTTPLNMLKPISRGLLTWMHGGFKTIEENVGIKKLAQLGLNYLDANRSVYEIRSICNDIHRKFRKSLDRGQTTHMENDEFQRFAETRTDNETNLEKMRHYFTLFTEQNPQIDLDSEENTYNPM